MKFGVVFPQYEIGADPAVLRDFVHTIEELGFDYLLAYDHVLGANPERPGGWSGPYTFRHDFHEVLVTFGWMAALTHRLEFATGILILPQRQTALVAKQVAQLSVLSAGRLRLGVGIGWNEVEYEALGQDFHTRGKRLEEQVTLLRELWSKPLVQFTGQFDTIPDAGVSPLPPRPIPIWFGGDADVALRRAARIGDGWMPNFRPELTDQIKLIQRYVTESGRDPAAFGIDVRIPAGKIPQSEWGSQIRQLAALGVSHISLNTLNAGYTLSEQHLYAMRRFKAEVDSL